MYSAVSNPKDCSMCFTLYSCSIRHHLVFSGKHSAFYFATTTHIQIFTIMCSQVLIHTAEWTGAMRVIKLAQGFTAAQDSNPIVESLPQCPTPEPLCYCTFCLKSCLYILETYLTPLNNVVLRKWVYKYSYYIILIYTKSELFQGFVVVSTSKLTNLSVLQMLHK